MVDINIDKDLIKKVAKNARLELSEEELEKFLPELKEVIINSFNKLDEIDTDEEPSFQPIEQKNKLRKDVPREPLSQEKALENVFEILEERGYIKGPKSIK